MQKIRLNNTISKKKLCRILLLPLDLDYLASQYRKSVSLFPLSCKVRFYGAGINYFYEPVEPHRV